MRGPKRKPTPTGKKRKLSVVLPPLHARLLEEESNRDREPSSMSGVIQALIEESPRFAKNTRLKKTLRLREELTEAGN